MCCLSLLQFVTAATLGRYPLSDCNITVPHVRMRCVTPAGVGTPFQITVTIADQTSAPCVAVLAYAPPVVSSVSPPVVGTTSGTIVTVRGSNFGASASDVVLLVNGSAVTQYSLVPPGHTTLTFTTLDLSGLSAVTIELVVGGQSTGVSVLQVRPVHGLPHSLRACCRVDQSVFYARVGFVVFVAG